MSWNPTVDCENPPGLYPCIHCGKHCEKAEQVEDGFDNRGILIRVFSMCAETDIEKMPKDDCRTEFGKEDEVVKEWNRMNTHFW